MAMLQVKLNYFFAANGSYVNQLNKSTYFCSKLFMKMTVSPDRAVPIKNS